MNHDSILMKTVFWALDKAVDGVPGTDSARTLADHWAAKDGTLRDRIDGLVRAQALKTGATGFTANIGGLVALPVAVPADLASLCYLQMRMVAAIAMLCGVSDMRDTRVRLLCAGCLAGEKILVPLKNLGIKLGMSAATAALAAVSQAAVNQVHKSVAQALAMRLGQSGAAHLGKVVPIVGGIVGGGVNMAFTYGVAKAAVRLFYDRALETDQPAGGGMQDRRGQRPPDAGAHQQEEEPAQRRR